MKAVLYSVIFTVTLTGMAMAAPRIPGSAHAVLLPLEQAATECFSDTVASNPRSLSLARAGRWYEAAAVTGFLCRPEVDAMVTAHDRIYGRGTGTRYFRGAYAMHLGQQLAQRLQPMLERKAVASADAGAEKASLAVTDGEAGKAE